MNWDAIRGIYYNTKTQTGTLQELNVKPGDVVEFIPQSNRSLANEKGVIADDMVWYGDDGGRQTVGDSILQNWRIISRASDDTPKKWGDMSDEEKGALLLAHHRGEVIEEMELSKTRYIDVSGRWMDWTGPFNPKPHIAYRIKPEPVRETVELYGKYPTEHRWGKFHIGDTHRITFDTLDGEPDPNTIKMERI